MLLLQTFDAIATTTKRLEIIKTLVGAFRAILATTPGDLLPIVYLCTNQVQTPIYYMEHLSTMQIQA